jgi:hypothetical protein
MLPIEYLIPANSMTNDEHGFATMLNLNWALATSKVACANINTIKRIIQIIKESSMKVSLIVIYLFLIFCLYYDEGFNI